MLLNSLFYFHLTFDHAPLHLEMVSADECSMISPGYQNRDSVNSSKFHHFALLALLVVIVSHSSNFHQLALLALLVVLVLHKGDSVDFNFVILYMIIGAGSLPPPLCFYS